MNPVIQLIRPKQWYKNLLVFLPLIFSGNLLNTAAIVNALIAFGSFCALSSATYVINDYVDKEKDKLHPEKKHRPLAARTITNWQAILIAIILLTIGFVTAMLLPALFIYAALAYFVLSQIYTLWLKNEAIADILVISTNFVIRAIAGALAIVVWISPWLIVGVFFLAMFLVLGKRRAELMFLKNEATLVRKTLATYNAELVSRLSTTATTALVISYALYVFFGRHQFLYFTLPIALYAIFRYEELISSGNKIARHPEYVFTDKRMVIAMVIWLVLTILIIY